MQLIQYSKCPIAAPSANRFGHVSPTRAEDVLSDLGDSVDFILDGGPTLVGVESTVVFVTEEEIILLRPGGIPIEDIEKVIVRVNIKNVKTFVTWFTNTTHQKLPYTYMKETLRNSSKLIEMIMLC